MVLYLCRMCQCGLHAVLWSHIGILMFLFAAEPRSPAGLLFHSHYLCSPILLTCIRWRGTGGFQRQGQCFFIGLSCSIPFCIQLFSLSLLPFYGLALWGWGLRTDWVVFVHSQPCIADLFKIVNSNCNAGLLVNMHDKIIITYESSSIHNPWNEKRIIKK